MGKIETDGTVLNRIDKRRQFTASITAQYVLPQCINCQQNNVLHGRSTALDTNCFLSQQMNLSQKIERKSFIKAAF